MSDVLIGPDGVARCPWVGADADYIAYHDTEWGVPVHGEAALFERIALESFQSGLSWITILRKRPAFRAAFAGFDPDVVAGYGDADVARACGSRSKGRGRRLLTYMEQRGFITSRSGLGNTRAISLPALGWETALGDPNADDAADASDEGGLFAAG